MKPIRLDKYLADMGAGSRSQLRQEIRKGLVQVNGETAKTPDQKINPDQDQVALRGEHIAYVSFEYYMLNKPAGVLSASRDRKEKTVLDLIAEHSRKDLFPVGRLDKDTEGLLLITNDGALAHELLHPKKHVNKTYFARLTGPVTPQMVQAFAEGMDIGDETLTRPGELRILKNGPQAETEITISEGRFHQIKRMAKAAGTEVLYLKRLCMGPLCLDPALACGAYRSLTQEEKTALQRLVRNETI